MTLMNILPILGIIPFVVIGYISMKLFWNVDWWGGGNPDKVLKVLTGFSGGFCFLMIASIAIYTLVRL